MHLRSGVPEDNHVLSSPNVCAICMFLTALVFENTFAQTAFAVVSCAVPVLSKFYSPVVSIWQTKVCVVNKVTFVDFRGSFALLDPPLGECVYNDMHCVKSKTFAKTLNLKRELDVTNNAHPVTVTTIRHCCFFTLLIAALLDYFRFFLASRRLQGRNEVR